MNTLDFLKAMTARETDKAVLDFITIDSPELSAPLRICNNSRDVVSRGFTFTAWAFQITTPSEHEDKFPTTRLTMDAIYDPDSPMEGGPIGVIQTINTGTVTLEWALSDTPDTLEAGPFELTITHSMFNAQKVVITLSYEDLLNSQWPGHLITPITVPGVFEG